MKKIYLLLTITLLTINAYCQKQGNIWYFADSSGIDFSSGSPVVLTNGNLHLPGLGTEGTATISDSAGHLLFYANAEQVWNRNMQFMPNGSGLLGGRSSTQGAFIIPKPGSSRYFYLFTTDQFQNNLQKGLRYNIIDMCLDNGLGDVMANEKNILLLDTVAEKMAGTNHANGTDIWLVTHKYFSDAFYAYRITANGITDTVITHIGTYEPNQPNNYGAAIGQMKISPDGSKLALVFSNTTPSVAELYDFNNTTGVVSNVVNLPTDDYEYGVSFSPDNSKLYISTLTNELINQYDSLTSSASTIIATKTLIANSFQFGGMQLGPDGKIYLVDFQHMDVINNPNLPGLSCNFVHYAFTLGGRHSDYGITNFIDSYHYHNGVLINVPPTSAFVADTLTGCNPVTVNFTNNSVNGSSFLWYFGDGDSSTLFNPTHTYTDSGTFIVSLIAYSSCGGSDTFLFNSIHVVGQSLPHASFTVDTLSGCKPLIVHLTNTSTNATSYWWHFSEGGTSTLFNPVHSYSHSGTYTITLVAYDSTACGIFTDTSVQTFYYTVFLPPTIPTISQQGDTLTSSLAYQYQWYKDNTILPNDTNQLLTIPGTGCYHVEITDTNGCKSKSDSICFSFAGINEITPNQSIILFPNPNNGTFTLHSSLPILHSQLIITDLLGRIQHSFNIDKLSTSNSTFTIPLSNGMYFYQLITPKQTLQGKFIIAR